MANSSSPVSAVADRYARLIFDLANEQKAVSRVETDLNAVQSLLSANPDLVRALTSPVVSSNDQFNVVSTIADKAKLSDLVRNFLRVVARNHRLAALPAIINAFAEIAADARGEAAVDVRSAHALTAAQQTELKAALKSASGKNVSLNVSVDPDLLGGLVVKIGSRQIDTSLQTKLNSLKLALKEVG